MKRPPPIAGMHHVALKVSNVSESEAFYVGLLGFEVEWRPDPDNVYLTSGSDNLALHKSDSLDNGGALDHIGIILRAPDDVDAWHAFLLRHKVKFDTKPKTHRDGARSFYCRDPDNNCIQFIYHPPIARRF